MLQKEKFGIVQSVHFEREIKVAKIKYVVAGIKNYMAGSGGEQGIILGEFRKIEFARQARDSMLKEAQKKGWAGHRGVFLNGKFIEEL